MKRILQIAGIMALTLGIISFAGYIASDGVQAANGTESAFHNTVKVNGTGNIKMQPDMAILSVGIETKAQTAQAAQNENSRQSDQVIETLRNLGINRNDIKTEWYNLSPNYNYRDGEQSQDGFIARHTLEVKIRDLDAVTNILDEVVKTGATNVNNVQYTLEDKNAAYDEAREKAAENAREKANKLGNVFDFTVGDLVMVEEYSNDAPIAYSRSLGRGGMESADASLVPGEIDVQLNLTAVFEIR